MIRFSVVMAASVQIFYTLGKLET
ncbi:hypothetical protein YQE_00608, partial [Dendroctonus ponderosae]